MSKIRRMFPGGNTSQGFYSLHDNIISNDRNTLYILKGMPGGGKSSLMKDIGNRLIERQVDLEYHHCPSDPSSIDGLVLPKFKIGIVDGTPPHSVDPLYPGLGDKIIDLAKYIEPSKLDKHRGKIIEAKINNKKAYRRAFNYFKSANNIHEEISQTNSLNVDFENTNQMTKKYLDEIFALRERQVSYDFKIRHMFSNAYTPEGFYDYTETLIADLDNIYYLNGDIGTGKSTFLERIIDLGKMNNYHMEIYHNALLPDDIESVLIHELNLLVSSNELLEEENHKTIDFNQYLHGNLRQRDMEILAMLKEEGINGLKQAKKNHFILEESYIGCVDYSGVDEMKEVIWKEIKGKI